MSIEKDNSLNELDYLYISIPPKIDINSKPERYKQGVYEFCHEGSGRGCSNRTWGSLHWYLDTSLELAYLDKTTSNDKKRKDTTTMSNDEGNM